MPPERRGSFKRNLQDDNIPVPRSTVCTRLKRQRQEEDALENKRPLEQPPADDAPAVQVVDVQAVQAEEEADEAEEADNDDDELSVNSTAGSDVQDGGDSDSDGDQRSISSDDSHDSSNASSASDSSESAFSSDEGGSDNENEDGDNDFVSIQHAANDHHVHNGGVQHVIVHEPEGRRHPLYEGARLSREESELLIMSFIIRWGLEDKAIEQLLRLVDCHMPVSLLGSKYLFLKKFPVDPSMKMRYFCPNCVNLLPADLVGPFADCACGHHCKVDDLKSSGPYFMQMSVTEQVQKIMQNGDLVSQMRKDCAESDVVSGKLYKRLRERGVIGDDDITFQWNTDGLQPFKSSKVSIYPIQACINELPARVRKDNMLLCGLYYGTQKPNVNTILKPFVDELEELHLRGVECQIPGRQVPVTVKVHTFLCSVDSVARPLLQGLVQFNGRYGCSFCVRRGRRVAHGRGAARVFVGANANPPRSQRQHLQALQRLEQLQQRDNTVKHVQGVKRGSVLLLLPVHNIIRSFVPDYMHAVLEGVVKTFWKHWCCSDYEREPWYLTADKRRTVDAKLKMIKPPTEVSRVSRSIDEMRYWRAHELKSFLLYYSLVCLKGVLPNRYLKHWFLLVYSMTVFLKDTINRDDFEKASHAVLKFVDEISDLYPNVHSLYPFNVHLLLHIPKAVHDFGALWASSTFPYEHFNGVLSRLITGTLSVPTQICQSFLRLRHIHRVSRSVFDRNDTSLVGKELYVQILDKCFKSEKSFSYSDGVRLFGAPDYYNLSLMERVLVERTLDCTVEVACRSYKRMILNGTLFHSSIYSTLNVRDNSMTELANGSVVRIARIVLVSVPDSADKFCICISELFQPCFEELCHDRDMGISSSDIMQMCRRTQQVIAVLPENIKRKCVGVPCGDAMCLIPVVNKVERG